MLVQIRLSAEQLEKLGRPLGPVTDAWGGFQRLIYRLQAGIQFSHTDGLILLMSPEDARRVVAYSNRKYGPGTYQEQIRAIEADVARVLRIVDEQQFSIPFEDLPGDSE